MLDIGQLEDLQAAVRNVRVDASIYDYVLDITDATRESEELAIGVSPRGAISLYRAAQALAVLENRDYVVPDDVKQLTVPVLSHRVLGKGIVQGSRRNVTEGIIREIVNSVSTPG